MNTTLYHVSPREIAGIHADGRWGSFLFFSATGFAYNYVNGTFRYTMDVDMDTIVEVSELFDFEESELPAVVELVEAFAARFDVDYDEAVEAIVEQRPFDALLDDACAQADFAEAVQLVAARIAVDIGFASVAVEDDTGVAYMVDMTGRFGALNRV